MRLPARISLAAAGAVLLLTAGPLHGQTIRDLLGKEVPPTTTQPATYPAAAQTSPPPAHPTSSGTPAAPDPAVVQLSQSNRDLLDLLKKQQAVLEDIQYDRRLQNRQIQLVEERLEETLQQNTLLETKIARLEGELADAKAAAENKSSSPPPAPENTTPEPVAPTVAPEPATYLPPAEGDGAPGTMWWHRVMTLSGTDGKTSEIFHITGRQWRVLWHNQDKEGDTYKNTSALFINAFPKDDTIPQKVCSKLGSGGDETDLLGPGNYYLKIEASGGKWELAVEDMR
jgi:hypothetical protein